MSGEDRRRAAEDRTAQVTEKALDLFQIAALMLGDEKEAVSLVEETIAQMEADPCADSVAVQAEVRPRLVSSILRRLVRRHPGSFAAPEAEATDACCAGADPLHGAAVSSETLSSWLEGAGRAKMREWLDQLAPALRAIFVLRAILGHDGERTAEDLRRSGAAETQGWGKEQVRAAYRHALCLLANSALVSSLAPLAA